MTGVAADAYSRFRMQKIDLATSNMDAMTAFYRYVFGIEFSEIEGPGCTLYVGRFAGMELLLAPAESANVGPDDSGIHQFHVAVTGDIMTLVEAAKELGCVTIDEVHFEPHAKQACIRDPDGNPWILTELDPDTA